MEKEDIYAVATALYEACEDMDAGDYSENKKEAIKQLCIEMEDLYDSNPNSAILSMLETLVDHVL